MEIHGNPTPKTLAVARAIVTAGIGVATDNNLVVDGDIIYVKGPTMICLMCGGELGDPTEGSTLINPTDAANGVVAIRMCEDCVDRG